MRFFKYLVIILVYKNADDLQECIASFRAHVPNNKIIIVNAFFDDLSKQQIEQIAQENDCDFINIPNKGYSYGNNRGIDYAKEHYQFDYLIISNPDILITQFSTPIPQNVGALAPYIENLNGKSLNPLLAFNCKLSKYCIYQGFKHSCKSLLFLGMGINKIFKVIQRLLKHFQHQTDYPIYAAHGCFVVFPFTTVQKITPLYDENFFLFAEECVIADRLIQHHLQTIYTPQIKIIHKEGGSTKISSFSIHKEMAKANMYYYEHYVKGK